MKSHFRDIPKDESGTKSGVMPNWTIKMPSLKLNPEHFMINEDPRNFVKEHFEKASEDIDDEMTKDASKYKQAEGKAT